MGEAVGHTLGESPQIVDVAVILPISIFLHFKIFLHVLFTYLFIKHVLNTYCVPGLVDILRHTLDTVMTKKKKEVGPHELTWSGGYRKCFS